MLNLDSFSLSIFGLVACINSSTWLVLEGYMKGRELTAEEMEIQTCNAQDNVAASNSGDYTCADNFISSNSTTPLIEEENTQEPKDYTVFLAALTAFIAFFNVLMIIFFNAPFKRALANKDEPKDT